MNNIQSIAAAAEIVPNAKPQPLVRLNRRFIAFTLLATLLYSWSLLVFGTPSYIQDSAAYYKGGRAAVSYAVERIRGPQDAATNRPVTKRAGAPALPPGEAAAKDASGVRSITYSVAAYLLSAPRASLVLLAIVQALAAGAITVVTLGAFGGLPRRRTTAGLVVLACATTVAPVCFLAIPDIFAGLLIASMVLLTAAQSRLTPGVRLVCLGIATFAVTAHGSHIPIAAGMTALGLGWVAIRRFSNEPPPRWAGSWIIAPLIVGGMIVLALNRVAFGETSLAAKRYPFALARSVDDGPARWYLNKHCPERKYAICSVYPQGLPAGGAIEFLWGPEGVTKRATPAELDRIRAEEPKIVLAAARDYPGFEAKTLVIDIGRQLVFFRPYPFEKRMTVDRTGIPRLVPADSSHEQVLLIVQILTAISAATGTVWLAWAFFEKRSLRPVIALIFLGILGNAVTCVALSAVAHRYEARVVWLIPLFALALRGSTERPSGSADHTEARAAS